MAEARAGQSLNQLADLKAQIAAAAANPQPVQQQMPRRVAIPQGAVPGAPGTPPPAAGGLPPGWQEVHHPDHGTYFYNQNTGETAWERPGGGGGGQMPLQGSAPQPGAVVPMKGPAPPQKAAGKKWGFGRK